MNNYSYTPLYAMMPLSVCTPDYVTLTQYFQKYFLDKAMSVFKWKLPKGWNEDYFKYTLYVNGYVAGLYTHEFGIICQRCGLLDYSIYDAPTAVYIGTQYVHISNRKIGDRCQLFYLNGDYRSTLDSINLYAATAANTMLSLLINLNNSKMAYVFACGDKKEAESLKKMYDQIQSGEAAVFPKNSIAGKWEFFTQNIGQNYIVDKLLADLRKIENRFNTEWGIPNTNVEKKERMVQDEVNSNNAETKSKIWLMLERLKKQVAEFNGMMGVDIMSVDYNKEVVEDANKRNDIVRTDISIR